MTRVSAGLVDGSCQFDQVPLDAVRVHAVKGDSIAGRVRRKQLMGALERQNVFG
jgi:hypothetical protein